MDENMNNGPVQSGKNGVAIAGFVVGAVSILWNFYCITGVVGLILSIIGMKKSKESGKNKGFAIAGIVCSIIGIVIGVFAIITIITLMSAVADSANEIVNSLEMLNSLNY